MRASIEFGDGYLPLLVEPSLSKFWLIEGRRGTGKTRAILSILLARALKWRGSRWMIARSTRVRLADSVLPTLEEQVFPAFGMAVPGGMMSREHRSIYRLPNGSEFIIKGLDDPQRGQSVEVAGVYVSEVVEVSLADNVTALAAMMRQKLTEWRDLPRQCICDCNPGAPGHWANQIAEPCPVKAIESPSDYARLLEHGLRKPAAGKWKRIKTTFADNPAYFDVCDWRWTFAGQDYLDSLGNLTGHLRRRWLDGEWAAAEGTVFPEFDPDRHVITPFEIPSDWPIYVGLDPGYDHPCAILWFAVAPNGTAYVIDELYRGGLGVEAHARDIKERNAGRTVRRYYADPQHAFSCTAQSPKSIATQFSAHGITFGPWPRSTDKEAMVEAVRQRLMRDRLKVFAPCVNTIGEFQSWRYKRNAKGEQLAGDDQYEDANNHAMDCVCGVAATGLPFERGDVRVIDSYGQEQDRAGEVPLELRRKNRRVEVLVSE